MQIYHLLAQMYIGKNDINRAINTYKAALKKESNSYQNLMNLANAYQLNGDYEQAIAQCNRMERLFPEIWKSKGHYSLSSILIEKGEYKKVIGIIKAKLSDSKESDLNTQSDLLTNWAYLLYLGGDLNTARMKLDEVLSKPVSLKNQLLAYLVKGYLLTEESRIQELSNITQTAQDSVNRHKDEPFNKILNSAIRFNYYFGKKDYKSAITEYGKMDDKGDFKIRYNYYAGLAYLELKEYSRVTKLIKEMRKPFIATDVRSFVYPRSFYLEGRVNEALGNKDLAKNNYQSLLNIWKDGDKQAADYQNTIYKLNQLKKTNINY